MVKLFKANPIASIILGVILIVLGVLSALDLLKDFQNFVVGTLILLLVFFLVFPELKTKSSTFMLVLYLSELIIGILTAIVFFTNGGNPSLWIGLVVYVHGLVELMGSYLRKDKKSFNRFLFGIVLITIGVFIFGRNLISADLIRFVLMVLFLAPGIYLFALGLSQVRKKKAS
jgi:uncharacterized membrane protein HdeD (DUF308 family)